MDEEAEEILSLIRKFSPLISEVLKELKSHSTEILGHKASI